jgi:hypothetical protein
MGFSNSMDGWMSTHASNRDFFTINILGLMARPLPIPPSPSSSYHYIHHIPYIAYSREHEWSVPSSVLRAPSFHLSGTTNDDNFVSPLTPFSHQPPINSMKPLHILIYLEGWRRMAGRGIHFLQTIWLCQPVNHS